MIDSEDRIVGIVSENGTGAEDNPAVVIQGDNQQAVQLNYNFDTAGTFVQLRKDYSLFDIGELARSNVALRFYARGSGTLNNVLFRLTDGDGDILFKILPSLSVNDVWQEVRLQFSSFGQSLSGTGSFDLFKISKIEVAIEKTNGGKNTLDIDKIDLILNETQTANTVLLDDFEGGTGSANQFNGSIGISTQDADARITTGYDSSAENVFSGNFSLKISYNAGLKSGVSNALYFNSPAGVHLGSISSNTATQIEFYAKASNDNEAFRLSFGTATQNQVIKVGGIGKNWQNIVIPFENFDKVVSSGLFGPQVGFSQVSDFVFIFTPDLSVGFGDIFLDDIRFTRPVISSGTVIKIIDDLEETTDPALTTWTHAFAAGSFATLKSIADGFDGRALRLNCNLGDGTFCTMSKSFAVNATLTDSFQFKYNYSSVLSGANALNDLELHIVDSDATQFKSVVPNLFVTNGQWRTLNLPLKTFKKVSGADKLNLRKISDIRFALIKNEGGKGIFAVDDFETVNAPKIIEGTTDRLIQSISTDNNPFSPNGDGVGDKVTFTYKLKESSKVKLRIYDSKGGVIKEFKPANPVLLGSNSFIWDGNDGDNVRVTNGLYFFQLQAEAVTSESRDKETSVVGVLR